MGTMAVSTPDASEYAPYYGRYISLVNGDDILATLETQTKRTRELYSGISEQDGGFRYAPEKWSIKQVFGHVIDTERIFAYRALRIARGDQTPIEGFEQDDYVRNSPSATGRWRKQLKTTSQSAAPPSHFFETWMKPHGYAAE